MFDIESDDIPSFHPTMTAIGGSGEGVSGRRTRERVLLSVRFSGRDVASK